MLADGWWPWRRRFGKISHDADYCGANYVWMCLCVKEWEHGCVEAYSGLHIYICGYM